VDAPAVQVVPPAASWQQAQAAQAAVASKRPVARLEVTADGGASYLEVRVGSATGRPLWTGVLAEGQSLRFAKRRLWLRLGAAGNLSLELNGESVDTPIAPLGDVLVTANGVRQLTVG
jgi:hypothetical protein